MKTTITAEDILGKDALDPDGTVLGVVTRLHIDKEEKKLTGISIDMGLTKPDLFIGIDYVNKFGKDAVLLTNVPEVKFKGKRVISKTGQDIGYVKSVEMKNRKVNSVTVIMGGIRKKEKVLPSSKIAEVGERIVLKD